MKLNLTDQGCQVTINFYIPVAVLPVVLCKAVCNPQDTIFLDFLRVTAQIVQRVAHVQLATQVVHRALI